MLRCCAAITVGALAGVGFFAIAAYVVLMYGGDHPTLVSL
jgi:hypothetical protein